MSVGKYLMLDQVGRTRGATLPLSTKTSWIPTTTCSAKGAGMAMLNMGFPQNTSVFVRLVPYCLLSSGHCLPGYETFLTLLLSRSSSSFMDPSLALLGGSPSEFLPPDLNLCLGCH